MLNTSHSLLIEQSGCHVASHSVYMKLFITEIYTVLSIGDDLQGWYMWIFTWWRPGIYPQWQWNPFFKKPCEDVTAVLHFLTNCPSNVSTGEQSIFLEQLYFRTNVPIFLMLTLYLSWFLCQGKTKQTKKKNKTKPKKVHGYIKLPLPSVRGVGSSVMEWWTTSKTAGDLEEICSAPTTEKIFRVKEIIYPIQLRLQKNKAARSAYLINRMEEANLVED